MACHKTPEDALYLDTRRLFHLFPALSLEALLLNHIHLPIEDLHLLLHTVLGLDLLLLMHYIPFLGCAGVGE